MILLIIIAILAILISYLIHVKTFNLYMFSSIASVIMKFIKTKYFMILSFIILCYFSLYNYSDYSHCTINRNIFTGEVSIDTIPGHNITWPWVQVSSIDLRPSRIPISSGSRTYNYRLVKFNPIYYREFVNAEGFRYYWWSNRISFNYGHDYESRGIFDILKGYAYDTNDWKFITIEKE